MSRLLIGWLAVMFLFLGGTGIWFATKYSSGFGPAVGQAAEVDTEYLKPPQNATGEEWLTQFTLTERSRRLVNSHDLDGTVYVTSFFFSSCPSTCLQQNQKIHEIEQQYAPQGVKFVSITCDPQTDTPERLKEYAAKLHAGQDDWLFLTGDLTYTRRIAGEIYKIPMDKQTHSERLFVTDKWGNIRGHFAWNKLDEVTALRMELDKLLAEQAPPPKPADPAESAN